MDRQTVEALGRSRLIEELLAAGLSVALPHADPRIDLIAAPRTIPNTAGKRLRIKASSDRGFSVDAKDGERENLLIVYLWGLDAPNDAATYALTYQEALRIAEAMEWTATESWAKGYYFTSAPSEKLLDLLDPYRMSAKAWREKITAISRVDQVAA